MTKRLRLVVPLLDARAPRRILPIRDDRSVATAQALDWPGAMLEAGRNDVAEVDELTLGHHYFGVNADRTPITIEVREPRGYRTVTLDPGQGWLLPAGDALSLRVGGERLHAYVRISIDPLRFERLVRPADDAAPVALHRTYGLGGPQVGHLVSALAAEAGAGTPSGLAYVDALSSALALQLVRQAGDRPPPPGHARGGLAPAVRRRVLEAMEAHAGRHLTLEALAGEAGLSLAHFARAFKASTGRAPHQHLMALRLERARRLLEAPGAVLSDVAARAGFSDQAHLTRLFKRAFGTTPGAFVRALRR